MTKNKYVILIVLIVIILILGAYSTINIINHFLVIEKKELEARVSVSDKVGFDINGSALTFGSIPGKGSSSREIFLDNYYNQSVKIEIYVKGEIGDFMQISENNFVLLENERKKVSFVVSFPEGTKLGEYRGRVYILIKKY